MKLTNYLREQLFARVRKHAFEKRLDEHANKPATLEIIFQERFFE